VAVRYCFDLKGQKQWQTIIGKEWVRSTRGERSVPTITDKFIYAGTGPGNLYCLDRNSGIIIWFFDMAKEFFTRGMAMC
jgi:outer membrane protein assembly factor BamB